MAVTIVQLLSLLATALGLLGDPRTRACRNAVRAFITALESYLNDYSEVEEEPNPGTTPVPSGLEDYLKYFKQRLEDLQKATEEFPKQVVRQLKRIFHKLKDFVESNFPKKKDEDDKAGPSGANSPGPSGMTSPSEPSPPIDDK